MALSRRGGKAAAKPGPRVAFVSPFLDKSHGTERRVVEWIAHLPEEFEVHIYSQNVEDLDLSKVAWHRIPRLPGPHLFNFLWWFAANHLWRVWDRRIRGLQYDIVFSPGINCFDADVVSVHIVFQEFLRRVRPELRFTRNPIRLWPFLLHRLLYYRLIAALERRVYRDRAKVLVHISRKTGKAVERFFGRREELNVFYAGIDHLSFNPARRIAIRQAARAQLGIASDRFALLLVGNDWHNKGLRVLLDALLFVRDLPVELLLVGNQNPAPFRGIIAERKLDDRVHFLAPRKDIEFYYAAADAYVGPSLEDAFALPPAEAMACGVPVIVSRQAGVSEIVSHGLDGLILDDLKDAASLAAFVRRLYDDPALCQRLGEKAVQTTTSLTWESNGRKLAALFERIMSEKARVRSQTIAQEL